jgi:hypothetical protein
MVARMAKASIDELPALLIEAGVHPRDVKHAQAGAFWPAPGARPRPYWDWLLKVSDANQQPVAEFDAELEEGMRVLRAEDSERMARKFYEEMIPERPDPGNPYWRAARQRLHRRERLILATPGWDVRRVHPRPRESGGTSSARRRGSRRGASTRTSSRGGDGGDDDPDPPGVEPPPARRGYSGVAP